jgi:phosphate transport system permease protein
MVTLVKLAAATTVAALVLIIGYIMVRGLPVMTPSFLLGSPEKMGRAGGIFPSIVGTLVSPYYRSPSRRAGDWDCRVPHRVHQGGPFSKIVRLAQRAWQASLPSSLACSLPVLRDRAGDGWSILSGSLTLAAMMLPTIVRNVRRGHSLCP